MAQRLQAESPRNAQPGDILLAIHEFAARSPDEITLVKGDRIELIEKDDDFGDGWYLAKHLGTGNIGLFPEVYTIIPPKPTANRQQPQNSQVPLSVILPSQSIPGDGTSDKTTPASTGSTPLHPGAPPSTPFQTSLVDKSPLTLTSASDALSRATGGKRPAQTSAVMNEMHNVINEHITDLNTPSTLEPPYNALVENRRPSSNGSTSLYSRDVTTNENTDDEKVVNSSPLTKENVIAWSPAKVALYLESVGVEKAHCDLFRDEEFTGEVLLEMDQSQIFMKEFSLGPIGRRMRTWQKIKALQDGVKAATDKPTPLPSTKRSVSEGYPPSSNSQASNGDRRRVSAMGSISSIPEQESIRPSAASIRDLGQARRHSSTDQVLVGTPGTSGQPAPKRLRAKQASFDRGWKMDGQPSSISNSPRPMSTTYLATPSSDMAPSGTSAGSSQISLTTADKTDLDRGYVSGGELEHRRTRNVLRRKAGSTDHKRLSSYGSDNKRTSRAFFWQKPREEKSENSAEEAGQKRISHHDGVRVVSEPIKGLTSPAVTRLEYDDEAETSKRISRMSANEAQRMSIVSDSRANSSSRRGLRTISDAVTGRERAYLEQPEEKILPLDSTIIQSPEESHASPTVLSPEDANKSEFSTPVQGVATSGTRRKPKKQTSAYIRGLEKKGPQEQKIGADYCGWMKKKSSNFMTNWKPRYFVLRGLRLSYYYSEDDEEEKGLIDISNHRVLPANNEFMTSLHVALTGNKAQTSSASGASASSAKTTSLPYSSLIPSFGSSNNKESSLQATNQTFIFKLVPPRTGLSKGVNFTKPAVHYFAVPSLAEGRLWMAELMKATIDRDESVNVITTYQQKTITLEQARARREMPPFLKGVMEEKEAEAGAQEDGDVSPKIRGGSNGEIATLPIDNSSFDDSAGKPPSSDADAEDSTTAGSSARPSSYPASTQGSYNSPGLQKVQREGPADLPQIVTNMEKDGVVGAKSAASRTSKDETPTSGQGLGIQGLSSGASDVGEFPSSMDKLKKEAGSS